jgi:hypothetical protein
VKNSGSVARRSCSGSAVPSFWLRIACIQPVISSSFFPSGVVKVMCAPGTEPLKYLPRAA